VNGSGAGGDVTKDERLMQVARELEAACLTRYREPSIPLRRVMEITFVPEATIRNWLTRNRIKLDADKSRIAGGHRLFSQRDTVLIAMLNSLSHAGMPVNEAMPVVDKYIMPGLDLISTKVSSFAGEPILYLWKKNGEWTRKRVLHTRMGDLGAEDVPPVAIMVRPVSILKYVSDALSMTDT
jgi:DNA-binding transcriptional MerR regulator